MINEKTNVHYKYKNLIYQLFFILDKYKDTKAIMSQGVTWSYIHKTLIEQVLRVCENRVPHGPRRAFQDPRVGGWGYLHPLGMLEYLVSIIDVCRVQSDTSDPTLYCGAESMLCYEYQHSVRPFNEVLLNRTDREFTEILKFWVYQVNSNIKDLEEPDAIIPWNTVKYILKFYIEECKKIMKQKESYDPLVIAKTKKIYHIRDGEYGVGCSVTKERCLWQIDIFRKYFITEGLDPSDPRYIGENFQYYAEDVNTRGDICKWWGLCIYSCFGVGWPKYTPRHYTPESPQSPQSPPSPTSPPPENQRPSVHAPLNQTKVHLTELLAFIEEKQSYWDMPEGDYLTITTKLKEAFESV